MFGLVIKSAHPAATSRRLVSADGAQWRIKPEIRTLARIIADRQAAERRTNPFGKVCS